MSSFHDRMLNSRQRESCHSYLQKMKDCRDAVKELEVGYKNLWPYIFTSRNAGKSKPGKRRRYITTDVSSLPLEDPFAIMTARNELDQPNENEHKRNPDGIRATLSSVNDRTCCRSILFDLKNHRIKWKLVPFVRNNAEWFPSSANALDPRLLVSYRGARGSALAKLEVGNVHEHVLNNEIGYNCSDATPIKCITERSSSIIRPRVLLRNHQRRLSYRPSSVNADMQQEWNKHCSLQPVELELIRKHVIPQWGSVNPSRFLFPFQKTDGLYWPIVQPYDAIDLSNENEVISADTKNQLVCLSELTFASKRQLLCGQDDQFHLKRYLNATEVDPGQPGRFRNRIGYMRVFSSQTLEDARVNDAIQQRKEAEWMARIVAVDSSKIYDVGSASTFQESHQLNSLLMSEHVDFNLSDMFSKRRKEDIRGLPLPLKISKGTRGPLQVPRQWLEVNIEHYVPTSQRKDYLCSYVNHHNRFVRKCEPRNKDAISSVVQYHLGVVKAIFIHQSGLYDMGMTSQLSYEDHIRSANRIDEIEYELKTGRTSMEKLRTLCELQEWEEKYWTIIWDNLSSIFRSAPPVSQLKLDQFISKAFESSAKVQQRGAYYSRFWKCVDRIGSW